MEVMVMAYPVEITISTGNKVSLNYQSEEVNVSITYKLERGEENVLEVVEQKAPELVEAHRLAWERVREAKTPRTPAPRADIEEETPLQEVTVIDAAALPSDEAASDDRVEDQDENSVQAEEPFTEKPIEDVTTEDGQVEGVQTPITPAQVQVILALSRALQLDETALEIRLSPHAGESVLECLTQVQAAALIVEMSRERRQQLDRERNGSRA